jgi:hypothetical protein
MVRREIVALETLDGWQVTQTTQPLPPHVAEVVKRVAANGAKEAAPPATRRRSRRNG